MVVVSGQAHYYYVHNSLAQLLSDAKSEDISFNSVLLRD